MKGILKYLAITCMAFGLLLVIVNTAISAPLTGAQGTRVQANFMNQDPDPADAGKDVELRWQVINTIPGTVDLKFRLDAQYPFLFEAGDSPDKDLGPSTGTSDNKMFYVLHYKLRIADNALKGTYNITLNWNTGDGWTKKDYKIYIDPRSADFVVGALLTSPEKLIADTKQAKLSVNIDNVGKGNAENVKVKLILPSGFKPTYSYSDEDSPGTIAKSSTKTTNFYVDVDENILEGEYNAKLEITYRDENDEKNTYNTKTLDLLIPIKPAPYLVVESITTNPVILVPGAKAEFRIKVRNNGNEKADSVSLRVFKDASQPFEFNEKSDFIGKLERNDSGEAVLRVTVNNNAVSKKYLIDVELRGIDEKNNVVIFRRTVPITVDQPQKVLPATSIIAVFIAIFGAAGYYRNKKGSVFK